MPFKKLDRKKKSVYVAEQIIDAIREGLYRVGDKLPPERVIAEKTGVSRPSVREALSALQIVGVVKSRHGDGTYVRKSIESAEDESQALHLLEEKESFFEALEVRKALEDTTIGLAIDQANSKDVEKIEKFLKRMEEAIQSKDHDKYLDANMDLHLAIAEASKNSLIKRLTRYLVSVMELSQEIRLDYYLSDNERLREALEIHTQIFSAIKNRDKELARSAMKKHFDKVVENLKGGDI